MKFLFFLLPRSFLFLPRTPWNPFKDRWNSFSFLKAPGGLEAASGAALDEWGPLRLVGLSAVTPQSCRAASNTSQLNTERLSLLCGLNGAPVHVRVHVCVCLFPDSAGQLCSREQDFCVRLPSRLDCQSGASCFPVTFRSRRSISGTVTETGGAPPIHTHTKNTHRI